MNRGTRTQLRFYATRLIPLVMVFSALPYFVSHYMLTFIFILFTYLTMSESFDILAGYTGYVNLGHATAFGLGAYVFAILFNRGYSVPISLLTATLSAVVYAALISFPLFKLRAQYFTIGTLGLTQLASLLAYNLREITGGADGLRIPSGDVLVSAYYIGLVAVLAVILTHHRIAGSKFGMALKCIAGDEEVARHCGINTFAYKCKVLILSSAFAGFMGGIYVWDINYVQPGMVFGVSMTFLPATSAMFGGRGVFTGPLVGTVLLLAVQEILWAQGILFSLLIYGIVLIIVGLFMPQGLVRSPWLRDRLRRLPRLLKMR